MTPGGRLTSIEERAETSGVPERAEVVCSARGCRTAATWVISWRNPRIHGLERRKTWSACTGHRDSLAEFLRVRSFLLDVTAVQ